MIKGLLARAAAVCLVLVATMSSTTAEIPPERESMLEAIRASVRDSASYTGRDKLSDRVMGAMATVPESARAVAVPSSRGIASRATWSLNFADS